MLIELAELLRCPVEHKDTYCVLSPDKTEGRRVISGVLGCPVCKAEYLLEDGVVQFGPDPLLGRSSRSDDITVEELPEPEAVQALLSLEVGGGYVALVGSATRLSDPLSELFHQIQFVGVNPPPEVRESVVLSLLRSSTTIPLMSGTTRGVVVGQEYAGEPWLAEAGRILMSGQRMVVANETVTPDGVSRLAADRGLWIGVKD
jgi:uncharacterized protein YbaR (Trm112 family)